MIMGSKKNRASQRIAGRPGPQPPVTRGGWSWRAFALTALVLAAFTFIVYMQILSHGFLQLDDSAYVTENLNIHEGITSHSIAWAFSTFHCANWHPLTWLSLMLDYKMYGMNPMGFHLTSLLFHIANSILLLLVLSLVTRSLWKSAFVAALFALHPLHVESVAWVAERKDVLSAFFWMLAMLAYWRYTRRPGIAGYALVVALLALGLMAKPMLVSLPIMLLLMDWWPLGRFKGGFSWNLIAEKIPLLVLSAASSVVTMIAQRHGGAVVELRQLSLLGRIGNALVAYCQYLINMVWPAGLSFFYTRIREVSVLHVLALIVISVAVVLLRRRRPYLAVGWLWYIVTLIPVIGIVQVGGQLMADRYTYVPLIGIFIMIAWGIGPPSPVVGRGAGGEGSSGILGAITTGAACLAITVLAVLTHMQVSYWKDDVALCERAISINPANYVAHDLLGMSLAKHGNLDEAIRRYEAALDADPSYAQAANNLGIALKRLGRYDEAAIRFRKVIELYPDYPDPHANLGNVYHETGAHQDELAEYGRALELNPDLDSVRINYGDALVELGRPDEAARQMNILLDAAPNNTLARIHLVAALLSARDYRSAWDQVHTLRQYGADVPPALLNALASKMPEPAY